MTENIPDIQRYRRSKTKTQKPFRKLLKGIRRKAKNPNILIMPELTIQPPISHIRMFLAETACLLIRYLIFF